MASTTDAPRRTKRRRTSDLPAIISVAGACEICGVNRMTFKRWRDTGYFDLEPVTVAGVPIWTRDDVERFAAAKGRQRAPIANGAAPG